MTLRSMVLSLGAGLLLAVCLAAPVAANNGYAGFELSWCQPEPFYASGFMRLDLNPYLQIEGKIGTALDGSNLVRGEANALVLIDNGREFCPYVKLGLGTGYLSGTFTPDLHLGMGFTYLLTQEFQFSAEVACAYGSSGDKAYYLNLGFGIRFMD